jgi:hypothetical protein
MTVEAVTAAVVLLAVVWFGVWAISDLLAPMPRERRWSR